jgi:hypothetical protein
MSRVKKWVFDCLFVWALVVCIPSVAMATGGASCQLTVEVESECANDCGPPYQGRVVCWKDLNSAGLSAGYSANKIRSLSMCPKEGDRVSLPAEIPALKLAENGDHLLFRYSYTLPDWSQPGDTKWEYQGRVRSDVPCDGNLAFSLRAFRNLMLLVLFPVGGLVLGIWFVFRIKRRRVPDAADPDNPAAPESSES